MECARQLWQRIQDPVETARQGRSSGELENLDRLSKSVYFGWRIFRNRLMKIIERHRSILHDVIFEENI